MDAKTLSILGTKYTMHLITEAENKSLVGRSGLIEFYSKEIFIRTDFDGTEKRTDILQKEAIRHEIVHAFFEESGLGACSDFGRCEEYIDWIAIQIPKMIDVMKEAGGL